MPTVETQRNAPVITTPLPVIHDTRPPIAQAPNLWNRIAIAVRAKGYSLSTERTYIHWAKAFTRWHGRRHPRDMGAVEVQAFLNHLAVDREVSPSTAKQALSALLFLYREVLRVDLPWLDGLKYPKGQPRLPVVLSQDEVRRLLAVNMGTTGLILQLLYGTGMRMMEALRLRVKDLDLERRVLTIREGKGGKDRTTMVPESLIAPLRPWLRYLPMKIGVDGLESSFQNARAAAGMEWAKFHDLRRSCATAMLAAGVDMIVISKLLGHSSVKVTESRYAHLQLDRVRAGLEAAYPPAVTPGRRKAA